MPWNFPGRLLLMKTGPEALITGNTIVAKPAPTTPLTCAAVRRDGRQRCCRRALEQPSVVDATMTPAR